MNALDDPNRVVAGQRIEVPRAFVPDPAVPLGEGGGGLVPLHAAAASALSLRLSARLLYAPLIPLNNGDVRSAQFDLEPAAGETFVGYGTHGQAFLGFVYYL